MTVYNFHSIGAYPRRISCTSPKKSISVLSNAAGAWYASTQVSPPWTTTELAVEGAAKYLKDKYLYVDYAQYTLFSLKFNVPLWNVTGKFGKMYAQNVADSRDKGTTLSKVYLKHADSIKANFEIPVFKP
jgi:beta-N-acetylglucosaminidase